MNTPNQFHQALSRCICQFGRVVHGCPEHAPVYAATPESTHAMLVRIITNQEKIMTALDNLQAADTALKAEITQFITDWQAQLANSNSTDDPAVQSVADDMNNLVAQLQGADPANAGTGAGTGASNAGTSPAGGTTTVTTGTDTTGTTTPAS